MSIKFLLVVCVGNICRSPMAQAILADALPNVRVASAGIRALVGQPPDPIAEELMAARGSRISAHRAQQVNGILCRQADMILVMDLEQRRYLQGQYPFATGRVFRIGEHANLDVPDPYRQSREMFEHALALIDTCSSGWIERMNKIG